MKIDREFKVHFADTGLLDSQPEFGVATRALVGGLSAYKGAVAENMVAAAFAAHDAELYYFRAPSGSPELPNWISYIATQENPPLWSASQPMVELLV